ncbi:hypothetical protein ACFFH4_11060 [Halalkalibacter alkalisediminis]|uniref:Uncharacterized protein n=1 Tax=Halalkalibacter alkalisediminis TaxID=935616 RepID=A0ABV6NFP5_9BACI
MGDLKGVACFYNWFEKSELVSSKDLEQIQGALVNSDGNGCTRCAHCTKKGKVRPFLVK